MDRFVLDRLARLVDRVTRAYDEYQFHTAFHAVHNFCAVDLSALYLDVIKDRLYTSAPGDPRRRAAQTVCHEVFAALARLMAPLMTFTAEEAWRYLPGTRSESVHLERFPEVPLEWLDDALKREWDRLLEVRREVSRALELARGRKLIGSGLEAAVRIASAPEDLPALLAAKRSLLQTLFIVSRVDLEPGPAGAVRYESQEIPGLVIDVDRAPGDKCERCWMRSPRGREPRASQPVRSLRGRRRRVSVVLLLAGAIVALDQITKAVVLERLPLGVPVSVIDGWLALTLVLNPGLAFGLLGTIPPGWRWVVAALSLVALAVLARVALRVLPAGGWMGRLAIGLIFGGAVGNLVDRARFGAVVDFVDVYWRGWHWPAFNVADSAITVGVALLALRLLNDRSTPAPS